MTFFVACIDLNSGKLTFANAGHNFPLLLREGQFQRLPNTNPRLGNQLTTQFKENTLPLNEGDLLFFYTDGVTENETPEGVQWGESRLKRYLKQNAGLSANQMVNHLVEELYAFYQNELIADDITIVACKVTQPFHTQ